MRGYVVTILLAILAIAAIGAAILHATGFDKAITAGFSDPVTPENTYVAGVHLGGLDHDALIQRLTDIIDDMKREKLVIWVEDDEHYQAVLGDLGFDSDPERVADDIFAQFPPGYSISNIIKRHNAINRGLQMGIPFEFDDAKLLEHVASLKETVDRDVVSASYDFENQTMREGVSGIKFDAQGTVGAIPQKIRSLEPVSIWAKVEVTEPDVKSEDLTGIDPTEPLASFTTQFNASKRGRSKNIGKLAEMFRGITLKPGDQLRFNETSGPRNQSTGYFPAPEFKNYRIIDGFGGGSCQVSTTLYNAALLSGMRIDERHPHSRVVFYVPRGRDATVNYNSRVDLKFTNTFEHPVVIWPRYDIKKGWLTFDIYGDPSDKKEIEITNSYTTIYRTESMDKWIVDESLAPGVEKVDDSGTNGVRVRTWRRTTLPDGSIDVEDLFYDVIPPMGRIIRYNPGAGSPPKAAPSAQAKTSAPSEGGDSDGFYF